MDSGGPNWPKKMLKILKIPITKIFAFLLKNVFQTLIAQKLLELELWNFQVCLVFFPELSNAAPGIGPGVTQTRFFYLVLFLTRYNFFKN